MKGLIARTLLASLLAAAFCGASAAQETTAFDKVNAALSRGEITKGRAGLEKLKAIYAPEKVSPLFRGAHPHKRSDCVTMALRGAILSIPEMEEGDRVEALSLASPRTAAALPSLPNVYNTEHFSIRWGDDYPLTDIDGTVPAPDENGNGDPDVIERWATYLEHSLKLLNENYGFPADVLTGRVVVVIGNTSSLEIYEVPSFVFGYTNPASPLPWMLMNNSFAALGIDNQDPENPYWGAMKVTAVHEFFHVLQLLYTPSAWNFIHDDWWLEASSVWSEDKVFDVVNDYYTFWEGSPGDWIRNPETSLQVSRDHPTYGYAVYGRGLFCFYLEEHAGGPSSMARVWELIRDGKRILFSNTANTAVSGGALEALALERGLSGVDELYMGFAAATSTMDYEEGANYPRPNLRSTSSIAVTDSVEFTPDYLGASYRREQWNTGPVRAVLSGDPPDKWGIAGVIKRGTPSYALCLASMEDAGTASFQFDAVQAADSLLATPSYLKPVIRPPEDPPFTSYSITKPTPSFVQGTVPPTLTSSDVAASPVTEGISLAWPAPSSGGVVIKYRQISGSWMTKTVIAPLEETVIGGLNPGQSHDIEIWLYDGRGVEGGHYGLTADSGPALPPIEPAVKIDDPPPPAGGGGGGGGGCFIDSLY